MKCEEDSGPSVPDPNSVAVDEEFQFLLCERCRSEVEDPKLLPCFHNLCSECLLETKPPGLCSICGTPHSSNPDSSKIEDNLLFAKLQAIRTIYQKVMEGEDLLCGNCKKEAAFWCPDCEEFMCTLCFESHQRYQKRESHDVKPLKDIRADSAKEFLAESKKQITLFCSKKEHKNQILSIFCNKCRESLCCVCALLDSKHAGQHCDIRAEIEKRQGELQGMGVKLKEKKCNYDGTYKSLQKVVENMEKVRNKTRAKIRQKIEEMVRTLKEEGDKFLADVEEQHKQQVQNVKKKLQDVDRVVKRMTSSEQLVEKMCLYASEKEVLEMQPFIQRSLEELKQKEMPAEDFQIQVKKFTKVKQQLQALFERVTKEKDNIQAEPRTSRKGCSPAKRKSAQEGKAIQTPAKAFKTNLGARKWITGPASPVEQPRTSVGSAGVNHASGIGDNAKGSTHKSLAFSCSSSESAVSSGFVASSRQRTVVSHRFCGSSSIPRVAMASSQRSAAKVRRNVILVEEKRAIIKLYDEGMRIIDIARKHQRPRSTVATIIQKREKIMERPMAMGASQVTKQRSAVLERVEDLLVLWIRDRQHASDMVTEAIIREKARQLYADLMAQEPGPLDEVFTASSEWFCRFKQRSKIHSVLRHGEAASCDLPAAEEFATMFYEMIHTEGYIPQQVFNADETGLF